MGIKICFDKVGPYFYGEIFLKLSFLDASRRETLLDFS